MQLNTEILLKLQQVSQTLNSSLEPGEVLDQAMEIVIDLMQAERGFIMLQEDGQLTFKAARNIEADTLEDSAQVSRTLIHKVMGEGKPVLATNAQQDPRFAHQASVVACGLRSVLCVPLKFQGQIIGVVYVDNRIKTGLFHETHLETLSLFANQAAVAIENARLYDDLKKSVEERLHLQAELQRQETLRMASEEANRLKSEFIGFVSHELRTPLASIRGYAQTLLNDTQDCFDRETRTEFHHIIEAEADRLLDLINDLLDISRLEAGRHIVLARKPLKLEPLVQRIARSHRFSNLFTGKHEILVEIEAGLPPADADEDRVHQILSNLVDNALKYSPDGGKVTIGAEARGGEVEIRVKDEGIGMTALQKEQVFGPYERLERPEIKAIRGTGLGLYLTRYLVDLHGGRIRVESEPGKGSTFSFTLPVSTRR